MLEADHEMLPGSASARLHSLGVVEVAGGRFLTENVKTRFERSNAHLGMHRYSARNRDEIDTLPFTSKHLTIVAVYSGSLCFKHLFSVLLVAAGGIRDSSSNGI